MNFRPLSYLIALTVKGFDFSIFDWMTIPNHAFNKFGYEPIHSLNHFKIHSRWILIPVYFIRHLIEHSIFHASSLKTNTLKIDAINELASINASLINKNSKDIRVQAILMPHLSKKHRY